jgi:hypothetical protein
MRLGRFALLVGFVALLTVTVLAWARTRRAPAPELPGATAATPPVAAQPSIADRVAPPPVALQPAVAVAAPPAPAAPPPAQVPPPNLTPSGSPELVAAERIDALVQAGDIGRARDAAEDFLRRYPHSSYCQHIETLTGVHPRPPIPGE